MSRPGETTARPDEGGRPAGAPDRSPSPSTPCPTCKGRGVVRVAMEAGPNNPAYALCRACKPPELLDDPDDPGPPCPRCGYEGDCPDCRPRDAGDEAPAEADDRDEVAEADRDWWARETRGDGAPPAPDRRPRRPTGLTDVDLYPHGVC